MPTGHWQFGGVPIDPAGHGVVCFGRSHLPFTNRVPRGQQFGGVPVIPIGH
jgi:hypothetical protein